MTWLSLAVRRCYTATREIWRSLGVVFKTCMTLHPGPSYDEEIQACEFAAELWAQLILLINDSAYNRVYVEIVRYVIPWEVKRFWSVFGVPFGAMTMQPNEHYNSKVRRDIAMTGCTNGHVSMTDLDDIKFTQRAKKELQGYFWYVPLLFVICMLSTLFQKKITNNK